MAVILTLLRFKSFLASTSPELLPNLAVFLDRGIVAYSKYDKEGEATQVPDRSQGFSIMIGALCRVRKSMLVQ